MKCQGPYEEVQRYGEVEYEIQIPHKGTKLFHMNLLKEWCGSEEDGLYSAG